MLSLLGVYGNDDDLPADDDNDAYHLQVSSLSANCYCRLPHFVSIIVAIVTRFATIVVVVCDFNLLHYQKKKFFCFH